MQWRGDAFLSQASYSYSSVSGSPIAGQHAGACPGTEAGTRTCCGDAGARRSAAVRARSPSPAATQLEAAGWDTREQRLPRLQPNQVVVVRCRCGDSHQSHLTSPGGSKFGHASWLQEPPPPTPPPLLRCGATTLSTPCCSRHGRYILAVWQLQAIHGSCGAGRQGALPACWWYSSGCCSRRCALEDAARHQQVAWRWSKLRRWQAARMVQGHERLHEHAGLCDA